MGGAVHTPDSWNLSEFVQSCSRTAADRVLTQRLAALSNKLLIEADQKGMPLNLLNDPTTEATRLQWEERYTRGLVDALTQVEQEVTKPTGWRRLVRGGITWLANSIPTVTLLGSIGLVLYLVFAERETPSLVLLLLPLYLTLAVLIVFHIVIAFALPVRWASIREDFLSRLGLRLQSEFEEVFLPIPDAVAAAVREERKQVEGIAAETREVAAWLREREQAAHVGELYGR